MRAFTGFGLLLSFGVLSLGVNHQARADYAPSEWDQDPAASVSLSMEPVRDTALTRDHLHLALKHFPRPGAQPVLLIHGLAQNDRGWDAAVAHYSFARYLHSQGFDVWVGNMRNAGTPGFRSETPDGPHHWSVEDYAIYDVPALVERVQRQTGLQPFLIGHSLAAWAFEGYLAGLYYDTDGDVHPNSRRSQDRQGALPGVVTMAGVYNLHWEHSLDTATTNPIKCVTDYYHSNYELELMARVKPLYYVVPNLPALPLGWIGSVLNMPIDQIPYIGDQLRALYSGFQEAVVKTPVLSMFYYADNNDAENVRLHGKDGLEDLGPHLIEQLANAINDGQTGSYYHLDRPKSGYYAYSSVRKHLTVPMLFVAGGRDRLASTQEIYQDGYLDTQSKDKQFIGAELFGHLDIVNGIHAPEEVWAPVVKWLRERSH